jgi:peptide deformylase
MARAICHENDHLSGVLYTDVCERMLTDEEIEEWERTKEEA